VSLVRVNDLTTEPVTLADMKAHLRVDGTDEDTYIMSLITAARRQVEDRTWRSLGTETWRQELDGFPDVIELYRCPVAGITSLKYIDADGALQTMANTDYRSDLNSAPARLFPAYGSVWPVTRSDPVAVQITYTTSQDPEPQLLHAIKLLVAHWFENREAVTSLKLLEVPMALNSLLLPRRVYG